DAALSRRGAPAASGGAVAAQPVRRRRRLAIRLRCARALLRRGRTRDRRRGAAGLERSPALSLPAAAASAELCVAADRRRLRQARADAAGELAGHPLRAISGASELQLLRELHAR